MRLLPSDPVRRKAALVVLLAVAGFHLFRARVHVPRAERTDALQTRIAEMRERNDHMARLEAVGGGALAERLARYEQHIARLETLIPASDEVAQLLEAVSREERRAGVEVTMMRPQPPVAEEFYERRSYELAVQGGYHGVGAFLAGVASLERIVVPDHLAMASLPGSETGGQVLATLQIRTYVAPAESDSAPAANPSPPAGDAVVPAATFLGSQSAPVAPWSAPSVAWSAQSAAWSARPSWLQETPSPPSGPPPPVPLVFEREVFRYPVAGRRDPFAVPGRQRAVLPARQPFRLVGMILHDDPRLRVAMLAYGGVGGGAPPRRPIRLRIGERADGSQLLEIAADGVILQTEGPHGSTVDTLRIPRSSGLVER